MANVLFKVGTRSQFDAIVAKNEISETTLYWLTDTQELYKGDILFGVGREASTEAAGLLSAADYQKLQDLIVTGGTINLTPVDSSIIITEAESGAKSIGVAISTQDGNALVPVEGGLFVPTVVVPEYAITKLETASEGFATSYQLKKTVGEKVSYVGDVINVPRDLVLTAATLETVTEVGKPYTGAVVGDPYIHMVFNDVAASDIYVPVKGLIDTYTAGSGIEIVDNVVSVKIAAEAHGLVAVEGGLTINLATAENDGAMSKEDKAFIDAIPEVYITKKYEISHKPEGTLVDYREKEIRVMCPADTEWMLQNSGEGADANSYYIGFKAYAPDGAASFKEDLAEIITDTEMYYFENNEFAGTDANGRKYSIVWLPVAKNTDGVWTYYGENSNETYIGWYYTVEWYNSDSKMIGTDTIRINLSNENCHNNIKSFYGKENDVSTEVAELQKTVEEMQEMYSWSEM